MTRKVIALAVAFVGLQAADSFLTMWAVGHGYVEDNPLMASMAHSWSMPAVKILPALVVAVLIAVGLKRLPKTWTIAPVVLLVGLLAADIWMAGVLGHNLLEIAWNGG